MHALPRLRGLTILLLDFEPLGVSEIIARTEEEEDLYP